MRICTESTSSHRIKLSIRSIHPCLRQLLLPAVSQIVSLHLTNVPGYTVRFAKYNTYWYIEACNTMPRSTNPALLTRLFYPFYRISWRRICAEPSASVKGSMQKFPDNSFRVPSMLSKAFSRNYSTTIIDFLPFFSSDAFNSVSKLVISTPLHTYTAK